MTETTKKGFLSHFPGKKILYPIFLTFFFLLVLFNQYELILIDKSIPPSYFDWAGHYYRSRAHYEMFINGRIYESLLHCISGYPNLAPQIATPFLHFGGINSDWAMLSQSVFWLILFISAYLLGTHMWNRDAGFLAGIFCFSIPYITRCMMAEFYLDLPCGAMIALSVLLLYKSEILENRRGTILFFIAVGLSAITKWNFVFYLLPISLLFFTKFILRRIREKRYGEIKILAGGILVITITAIILFLITHDSKEKYIIAIAVLSALLVASGFMKLPDSGVRGILQGAIIFLMVVWHNYSTNFGGIYAFGWNHFVNYGEISPSFLRILFIEFMGLLWGAFFITGITCYIFSRNKSDDRNIFILTGILGVLILGLNIHKHPRYLSHLMIFFSIISTYWITLIPNRFIRYFIVMLFFTGTAFSMSSWRLEDRLNDNQSRFLCQAGLKSIPIQREDWREEELGCQLKILSRGRNTLILVFHDSEGGSTGKFDASGSPDVLRSQLIEPLINDLGRFHTGNSPHDINHTLVLGEYMDRKKKYNHLLFLTHDEIYDELFNTYPEHYERMIAIHWGWRTNPADYGSYRLPNFPSTRKMDLVLSEKIKEIILPCGLKADIYYVDTFRGLNKYELIR